MTSTDDGEPTPAAPSRIGRVRTDVAAWWARTRRQGARVGSTVAYGAKGAPVSLTLLAAMWIGVVVISLTTRSYRSFLDHHIAVGIVPIENVRLWTPVTSGLFALGVAALVVSTLLFLLVAAPVEHRMGTRRFAAAVLVTQIGGSLLGLALAALGQLLDEGWGFQLHLGVTSGPTAWILGTLMVASSDMGTLWRRRVRVGLVALTVVMALFGGHLTDITTLGSVLVGGLAGPLIVGKSPRASRLAGTRREGRVLVALIVAASAVGPMIAAFSPNAVGPFAVLRELFRSQQWTVDEVNLVCGADPGSTDCRRGLLDLRLGGVGPTVASVLPSLYLLVLADGLRRGRRFAWTGAVLSQFVLIALALANYLIRFADLDNGETLYYGVGDATLYRTAVPFLVPLAVLALLVVTRKNFDVRAPAGTYRRVWIGTASAAVALAVIYVAVGTLVRGGFDGSPSALALLGDFPQRLVPPILLQWFDPPFLPDSGLATVLYEWTGIAFWATLIVLTAGSFVKPAYGVDTDATERARAVLSASSGSALSWMTTWSGNRYWFSGDGRSYVAFRVISGIALTTGDPVGPPADRKAAIVGFSEYASANGWSPCFYSVTPDVASITGALGWESIQVGEETVLPLDGLAFTGKKFQDVRTAVNRAKKAGVEAEWISFPTAPLAITDQITAISEEWVADKGMPEMGFTLGGLDEVDDPQVRCLIAVDEHRTVHGITSWMPVYRDGEVVGWTLDFMRRRSEGFRPAMEFLIASAALSLQEEGAQFLSLSGAPLAKVGDPTEESPATSTLSALLERLLDVVGRTLEPVYGFRSLLAFKSKFQPVYEPMYMTFPDAVALPSIANAIGRAYLPDVSLGQSVKLVRTMIER
ncbi:bifunctional lysylphosphatidylglycerol flippase/synthetase MprF [Rhodococcus sp. MEB064]|uniref:bifunctional lysylphosphatidylglycerol flippase/synthetase MprF n=1 Tax=Rhodococcus sp. MEB064 TaxID=1587522 RepID=UPI0005ACDDDC|nr:membrane protein [Rhodococcus sp. MEB064]